MLRACELVARTRRLKGCSETPIRHPAARKPPGSSGSPIRSGSRPGWLDPRRWTAGSPRDRSRPRLLLALVAPGVLTFLRERQ